MDSISVDFDGFFCEIVGTEPIMGVSLNMFDIQHFFELAKFIDLFSLLYSVIEYFSIL